MNDDVTPREGSVSRRTMLKRIGAAGAVAWVAPVISSLNTPAHAASGPGAPCDTPGNCDTGFTQCGTCGPIDGSFCYATPTGAGFCGEDSFCDGLTSCAPGSCPPGFECAVGTACSQCDSAEPGVCIPFCAHGQQQIKHASVSTRHGLTTSGRRV